MQTKSANVTQLVTASLIGAGAGVLIASRMVKTYDRRTEWLIHASLPTV